MIFEQKIRMAIAHRGTTQAAVARAIGMSRQSFHRKLKKGTFTIAELEEIAHALGARFTMLFRFRDESGH